MRGPRGVASRTVPVIALVLSLLGSGLAGLAQQATPVANAPYSPLTDLNQLRERVIADGSSTVYPITAEAADRFMALAPVPIDVEFSGAGGGFRRFCAGESDIQNASRPITEEERGPPAKRRAWTTKRSPSGSTASPSSSTRRTPGRNA